VPTIEKFTLKNFKGIEEVSIDLHDRANSPVITLIGLNESGKTTILEGLSHFVSGDKSVTELFDGIHSKTHGAGLIPVHKKAAFTSEITISARVRVDNAEVQEIEKLAKTFKLEIDFEAISEPFEIRRVYKFEDSAPKGTKNIWTFKLKTRKHKKSQYKTYVRPAEDQPDLWLKITDFLGTKLSQIAYFPTFLVDMPTRIYLKEYDGEKAINRHYRIVFQDVLDSLGEGLLLDRHVCQRISDFKATQNSPNWFSMLFGSSSKAPIDSVFQKISNLVTKEVLGSWQRVFQRAISAKSIFVEWNIDTEKGDLPYASFHVSDGESRYAISERSLGFRWFFSFLLFTAFKQAKSRSTIFIFDEPAANLHAKAQAELLTSFSKIASDGNKIIYSTHSHHMINPRWLSGAYIVENTAIDYDTADSFGLNAKPTNVRATKYKEFISRFPSRSSYFQPVIEKLEYVSPELVGSPPFVVLEGISDYYALRLAMALSNRSYSFRLLPGVGSGASGPLISQMMGRGEDFIVLLDDDKAGKIELERYKSGWHLSNDNVFTLGHVATEFSGMSLEALLGNETFETVAAKLKIKGKPSKKQLGWYLAEHCSIETPAGDSLPENAINNLAKVLDFLEIKVSSSLSSKT
jgi:ABC-type Mn2+/Zn2+ transport system ATPase subunit